MDAIQHAINAPIAEVSIDGAAGRQILGKVTPLASRAQHVHDGVERLSHVRLPFAASSPCRRNERFDIRPLLVRQVAWVSQMITLVFRSVLVRPHRRPPNQSAFHEITTEFHELNNFRTRHLDSADEAGALINARSGRTPGVPGGPCTPAIPLVPRSANSRSPPNLDVAFRSCGLAVRGRPFGSSAKAPLGRLGGRDRRASGRNARDLLPPATARARRRRRPPQRDLLQVREVGRREGSAG